MLDFAYDTETFVIDDPDLEPPAVGRVATAELTMQVLILGRYHRRTPDLSHTACGIPFHSEFTPPRREQYGGTLCPECFTTFELALSEVINSKEIDP